MRPIRVGRLSLLSALDAVQPGLSATNRIEQSGCFIFKSGRVQTFNDEVACRVRSPLKDKLEGAVPAKQLQALLRLLPDEEVDVLSTPTKLIVKGKRSKTDLLMDAEVVLPVDEIEQPTAWGPLHKTFTEAVGMVEACASKDSDHFVATCVHVHPRRVEATDGFRIARYKLRTGLAAPTLVKRDSLKHIIGLDMTEVGVTDNWLHFRNPAGLEVSCRRHLDKFLDMTDGLKISNAHAAVLPKGLGEVMKRAELFSAEDVDNNEVTVTLKDNRIWVVGQSASGRHRERRAMSWSGTPVSFVIPPKLLAEISERYNDVLISDTKIKVDGGRFQYVAAVGPAEEV